MLSLIIPCYNKETALPIFFQETPEDPANHGLQL